MHMQANKQTVREFYNLPTHSFYGLVSLATISVSNSSGSGSKGILFLFFFWFVFLFL